MFPAREGQGIGGSMRKTVVVAVLAASVAAFGPAAAVRSIEVVAAGDIATSGPGDRQTSDRVIALDPAFVLTLGDHAYPNGTSAQFDAYYAPTWGRFRSITRPTAGNHDWRTAGASGYESYFGVQAGVVRSFVIGEWRVIALDSNVDIAGQRAALNAALSADGRRCELLYFHHPRWSSGEHGDDPRVGPWWTTAYAHGVDVILNGHDHDYERFAMKSPTGASDPDGIREFVVGTGGVPTRPFDAARPGSQRRITGNANWGVLALDLLPGSYSWRFVDADSGSVRDSGSTACHA